MKPKLSKKAANNPTHILDRDRHAGIFSRLKLHTKRKHKPPVIDPARIGGARGLVRRIFNGRQIKAAQIVVNIV